ncbi:MAG: hypothetical protein ACFFBD_16945 [Candidatus Hodarchaeota archaeon]
MTTYGVTKETYEAVTRTPGSFAAFMRGLSLLLNNNIQVRLKAMVLRSNVYELSEISRFCRERTKDFYRFDPFLHLRFDGNSARNEDIKSERLSPEENIMIEKADSERFKALRRECTKLIAPGACEVSCNHLFHCDAGNTSFTLEL